MELKDLQAMGLVTANPLMKHTFAVRFQPLLPAEKWSDPEVPERQEQFETADITVYLRKLTASDQIVIAQAIAAKRDYSHMLLHRCVFNEKGERVFPTEDDAVGVNLVMFAGLIAELNKVNGTITKKAKPGTSSGASLPSPSAVDQSESGKPS